MIPYFLLWSLWYQWLECTVKSEASLALKTIRGFFYKYLIEEMCQVSRSAACSTSFARFSTWAFSWRWAPWPTLFLGANSGRTGPGCGTTIRCKPLRDSSLPTQCVHSFQLSHRKCCYILQSGKHRREKRQYLLHALWNTRGHGKLRLSW